MNQHDDYEHLAARAERGELRSIPGTQRRGPQAAQDARAMLLAATGADTITEATALALGRPKLGEERPSSTTWRVRATTDLDVAARAAAEREGVPVSVIVRKAVAEYVAAHAS